jgi:putative sterol carrier protein
MDSAGHDDVPNHGPDPEPAAPAGAAPTPGTVRYLGLDWIRELSREVAESETMASLAASHRIGVTQIVTDGPEGTVVYHLQVGDGRAEFGAGPADPEDVVMEQAWATAVGVATGELNAHEAFMTGRIKLRGDQELLLASQPVFGALDAVFGAVRPRTDYS